MTSIHAGTTRGAGMWPDLWAFNGLAAITAQRGQTDGAMRLFEQAISTNPDVPNPYYGLGTRYAISAGIIESSVQLTIV